MKSDDEYAARREELIELALSNVGSRLGTLERFAKALLDEVDRLYDLRYRPHQAELRRQTKESIRQAVRNGEIAPVITLPRRTLH